MAEFTPSTMQSELRVDPAARDGVKRLLSMLDADQQAKLIRDCLRKVKRPDAVAVFNQDVHGNRMPANSDRGRIGAMLRTVLRAGRPDAYECLQTLSSAWIDDGLDEKQYEAYNEAVDALNECAEAGETSKIPAAAETVVAALRIGLDNETIERYVILHALPETLDALLAAARAGDGASGASTAGLRREARRCSSRAAGGRSLDGCGS